MDMLARYGMINIIEVMLNMINIIELGDTYQSNKNNNQHIVL